MAYFDHAFRKVFVGTKPTQAGTPGVDAGVSVGMLIDAGLPSSVLADTAAPYALGVGTFGFFDHNNGFLSVNAASPAVTGGKPLTLAASSLYADDKVGPFHGGYKESTKSKYINPKYISEFYRVDPCTAQANIVHVGNTNYTATLSPQTPSCCHEFLCGETYYLRIDVKGSPALRALNHNAYHTVDFYTGCCADPTPDPVDSTLVMIGWAEQILNTVYLAPYISPVVFDEAGVPWFAPGTTVDTDGNAVLPSQWWTAYVSPGHTPDACAGLRLQGAYVDTRFGDCSFQVSDFFEKEPVKIYASLVDQVGDPCTFEGICVVTECPGLQGMGFGEQVLRDLILSESYMQNYFSSDIRIREITQGNQTMSAISRTSQYYTYHIIHNVPRLNNPTGVFDNDRYELVIVTTAVSPALEALMAAWLQACGCEQVTLQTFGCTPCTPVEIQP